MRPAFRRYRLIPRNRWFTISVHRFLPSDDPGVLHDHPWDSISILLRGSYREVVPGGFDMLRTPGDVVARRRGKAHRVEVLEPCWTLFITGREARTWSPKGWVPRWGYIVDDRWVPWWEFNPDAEGERSMPERNSEDWEVADGRLVRACRALYPYAQDLRDGLVPADRPDATGAGEVHDEKTRNTVAALDEFIAAAESAGVGSSA